MPNTSWMNKRRPPPNRPQMPVKPAQPGQQQPQIKLPQWMQNIKPVVNPQLPFPIRRGLPMGWSRTDKNMQAANMQAMTSKPQTTFMKNQMAMRGGRAPNYILGESPAFKAWLTEQQGNQSYYDGLSLAAKAKLRTVVERYAQRGDTGFAQSKTREMYDRNVKRKANVNAQTWQATNQTWQALDYQPPAEDYGYGYGDYGDYGDSTPTYSDWINNMNNLTNWNIR